LELILPTISIVIISTLLLIGVLTLALREKLLDRILSFLISFSAGTILGAAFFDLLPEGIEILGEEQLFPFLAIGFSGTFFLERSIYWYHGHGHEHDKEVGAIKSYVYLNLVGDGAHNLLDGMIIAATFQLSIPLGIATTIAVIFHELPQEIGDFGILVFGGFSRKRALLFNFLTSLTSFIGLILTFILIDIEGFTGSIIALAGGGFIYLAASEILPEIKKEKIFSRSLIQYIMFILGLSFIWSLDLLPF